MSKKYQRLLELKPLLEQKSHFLFGARSTGKTTLMKETLSNVVLIDLLMSDIYTKYLKHPENLRHELQAKQPSLVVIDEVQKLPQLLDEVHWLIENTSHRFLLTGSSARKLKRGSANLLAGRAWVARLFPLCCQEIPHFDLHRYLVRGGLPHIYDSPAFKKELHAYVNNYIKEEIVAEALTRNVKAFTDFLDLMATQNSQEINYESFAKDAGVSPVTVKNYLEILVDTHVGHLLPAFKKTKVRRSISRAKFYFFDIGVANTLLNQFEISEKTPAFGVNFEHFILMELIAWINYTEKTEKLSFWRSHSGYEVDFIYGDKFAIEVKSASHIQNRHLKGLRALREEDVVKEYHVVCLENKKRITDDGIHIWPYRDFISQYLGAVLIV